MPFFQGFHDVVVVLYPIDLSHKSIVSMDTWDVLSASGQQQEPAVAQCLLLSLFCGL